MRIAITGGAGFIGSNFVHYWLREHGKDSVAVIDKLTYAGNMKNLGAALTHRLFEFFRLDAVSPEVADAVAGADAVVHFAAESHVDRSILNAGEFVRTNVQGTQQILEACRQNRVSRFILVSTDEVYGSLGPAGNSRNLRISRQTALMPRVRRGFVSSLLRKNPRIPGYCYPELQ